MNYTELWVSESFLGFSNMSAEPVLAQLIMKYTSLLNTIFLVNYILRLYKIIVFCLFNFSSGYVFREKCF